MPSVVPEDLEVVQLGEAGDLDLVPQDESTSVIPKSTLPFGLPPVLPDLNSQLEEFLDHPERLPIHDLDRVQKFIPRKPSISSLFSVEMCPLQTTLQVERDRYTGKLLGFKEVRIDNKGTTAKNSTSLKRAPGAPSDSIRGGSSSLPFWPGGMDEPSTEILRSELLNQEINFRKDLLTTPPGFKEGMIFSSPHREISHTETDYQAPSVLNLDDIWALEEAIDLGIASSKENLEKPKSESKRVDIPKPSPAPLPLSVEDTEEVEKVLSASTTSPSTTVLKISKAPTAPQMTSTKWAHLVDTSQPVNDFHKKIPKMAKEWPFELDIFQKQAILHLEKHDSIFVAAHTSAGKTVPAEYAIALCKQHMTKVVYTSPIKALSNQKYRDFKQTFDDVGLITGDVQINATAFCLIMTTEILRSMLYHGSDVIRDVEWAIFDEVHYINDKERGVVWEEVLIMLPDHINLILLSATVSNIMKFADWLGAIKKKKIYVIRTLTRPVPLEHFLYTGSVGKTQDERFLLIDSNSRLQKSGYQLALDAKKSRDSKGKQAQGAKGPRYVVANKQEKNIYLGLLKHLRDKDKLPVVCFILSRKGIDEKVLMMESLDLTTKEEKNEIHHFMQTSISKLKESDRKLSQISTLKKMLIKGLGVHHSGILPILKEVVEMLFQRGLVKVLFATETFAMGVNMPARTVVFDSIQKFDGKSRRDLNSSEYIQMAGRAGRRGHDKTGTVIILCKGDIPEISALQNMMMGKPENLSSQFRLTYSMILNLKLQSSIRVEDMMKRSFAEASFSENVDYKSVLAKATNEYSSLPRPECSICDGDIKDYCKSVKQFHNLRKSIMGELVTDKVLSPGRLVVLSTSYHQNVVGVILSGNLSGKDKSLKVLTIADSSPEGEKEANLSAAMTRPGVNNRSSGDGVKKASSESLLPWTRELFFPENSCGHDVIDIATDDIQTICDKCIKIEPDKVISNWKKRQQPRFVNDPPNQATSMAMRELYSFAEANEKGAEALNLVKELHISGIEKLEKISKLKGLVNRFDGFACLKCPHFTEHFSLMNKLLAVEEKIEYCKLKLSEESLTLHSEYKQRLMVLKRLRYINEKDIVQMKGKVAREINNHELLLTELLVRNVLSDRHPEEIAALLSCVVFPQRTNSDKTLPKLDASLTKGMEAVLEVINDIDSLQTECQVYDEDFASQYNFDLADAVYKWAKGTPFVEIMAMEGVQEIAQEGIIVRCIQRLNDTLKDLKNAAKLVGEPTVMEKMVQASQLIKRDIVFAASLYTQ